MANAQNLIPWKPGQSGTPTGKPKGTKHLSKCIREAIEDATYKQKLEDGQLIAEMPVKAIVSALIAKAIAGDYKAIDLLAKYGYGTKMDVTSDDKPLPVPIMGGLSGFSMRDIDGVGK